jgi:Phycobilisome protein
VEDAQKWLARHLADAVGRRADDWAVPREPLAQDFARAVNPVAVAMLLDDPDVLAESVVRPLEEWAAALDIPPAEVGDLFAEAWQALAARLDARSAALLEPYFDRVTAALAAAEPVPALAG